MVSFVLQKMGHKAHYESQRTERIMRIPIIGEFYLLE